MNITKDMPFFYWPDIIFEQYFLQCLINKEGCSSRPIVPNYPTNQAQKYAMDIGFEHIGSLKFETLEEVKYLLKICNPNLYNITKKRTEELVRKYS
jgi:hypothetical protein